MSEAFIWLNLVPMLMCKFVTISKGNIACKLPDLQLELPCITYRMTHDEMLIIFSGH